MILYKWIQSYLTNRQQRVVFNGGVSGWQPVKSGVPQGSVLGPLFFNMFVNDIPTIFSSSHSLLFADDLKLFRMVRVPNDAQLLQEDLDKLCAWSSSWKLALNPTKCKVLTLTLKKQPVLMDYKLSHFSLDRVTDQKDLGILIDSKLTFNPHADYIVAKANRMLGIFWRHCKTLDPQTKQVLYCSLVRPSLEFSSVCFNSLSASNVERIESVQRKFLRFLGNSVDDNVCQLKPLDSLKLRRQTLDLTFLYKCVNSYFTCNMISFFALRVSRIGLRSPDVFHVPLNRVSATRNGFIHRLAVLYNSILKNNPSIDIFSQSLLSFKSSVCQILRNSSSTL